MDEELQADIALLRAHARASLADYLASQRWDYFLTTTFDRPERHPWTAIYRTAEKLHIHQAQSWENEYLYVTRAFIAAEPHKLGNWHCHSLLDAGGASDAKAWVVKQAVKRLGWCRLEPVRNVGQVCNYASKYVLKESRGEYQFFQPQWTC